MGESPFVLRFDLVELVTVALGLAKDPVVGTHGGHKVPTYFESGVDIFNAFGWNMPFQPNSTCTN